MNVDTDQFQALRAEVDEQHAMLAEMREALRNHMAVLYEVLYWDGYEHGRQDYPQRPRRRERHTAPRERHLRIVARE